MAGADYCRCHLQLIAVPVAVAVTRFLDSLIWYPGTSARKGQNYTVNLVFSSRQGCLWFCFGQQ